MKNLSSNPIIHSLTHFYRKPCQNDKRSLCLVLLLLFLCLGGKIVAFVGIVGFKIVAFVSSSGNGTKIVASVSNEKVSLAK